MLASSFTSLLPPPSAPPGPVSAQVWRLELPAPSFGCETRPETVLCEAGADMAALEALSLITGGWAEVSRGGRSVLLRLTLVEEALFPRAAAGTKRPPTLLLTPLQWDALGVSPLALAATVEVQPRRGARGDAPPCPRASRVVLEYVRGDGGSASAARHDEALAAVFRRPWPVAAGHIVPVPSPMRGASLLESAGPDPGRGGCAAVEADRAERFLEEEAAFLGGGGGGGGAGSDEEEGTKAGAPPYYNPGGTGSSAPLAFFRVASAEPAGAAFVWVCPENTELVQHGATAAAVPWAMERYAARRPPPAAAALRVAAAPPRPSSLGVDLAAPFEAALRLFRPAVDPAAAAAGVRPAVLLSGARASGKRALAGAVSRALNAHLVARNCFGMVGGTESAACRLLREAYAEAEAAAPSVLYLRRLEAFSALARAAQAKEALGVTRTLRTLLERGASPGSPLVLVLGGSAAAKELPAGLRSCFEHDLALQVPDAGGRAAVLGECMAAVPLDLAPGSDDEENEDEEEGGPDDDDPRARLVSSLVARTAGLSGGELRSLVSDVTRRAVLRARGTAPRPRGQAHRELYGDGGDAEDKEDDAAAHAAVRRADARLAVEAVQERASQAAGTSVAGIPNVRWSDIGGLEGVKRQIVDTIELPLSQPHLFAGGAKQRSGILLYGPPGTGKTLIAKAVATECALNFISVKGPELLNMYVGESERNVREVFERARNARPCVLFFDEMDSLAPARGNGSDGGGVMDRVVSQLLTELDGMDGGGDLFVIGATNRPDLLDSALLRPGRLDRCVYLGVSDTHEAQVKVIEALSRKFVHAPDVDLPAVAATCSFTFTGADFYALCSDAMLAALTRTIDAAERRLADENRRRAGLVAAEARRAGCSEAEAERRLDDARPLSARQFMAALGDDDPLLRVTVTQADYLSARAALAPSLSEDELRHYARLRAQFSS